VILRYLEHHLSPLIESLDSFSLNTQPITMNRRPMNLLLITLLVAMVGTTLITLWQKHQAQQRLADLTQKNQQQLEYLETLEERQRQLEESLDQKTLQVQSLKEQIKEIQQ